MEHFPINKHTTLILTFFQEHFTPLIFLNEIKIEIIQILLLKINQNQTQRKDI